MSTKAEVKSIRDIMVDAIKATNANSKAQGKLDGKKAGVYTCMVLAGIESVEAALFEETVDALFNDVRHNVDKLATSTGCKAAKKQPKEGGKVYEVPGSIRSAKSVVLGCMTYGLELAAEDGTPTAYSQLRKDLAEAKAIEAEANMTDGEVLQSVIHAKLDNLKARFSRIDSDSLALLDEAMIVVETAYSSMVLLVETFETAKAEVLARAKAEAKAEKAEAAELAEAGAEADDSNAGYDAESDDELSDDELQEIIDAAEAA